MSSDMVLSAAAFGIVLILSFAASRAWRGWLELKRLELGQGGAPGGAMVRIELADMRERLRKLEAIASGVDL
jgi:hypothetical protein